MNVVGDVSDASANKREQAVQLTGSVFLAPIKSFVRDCSLGSARFRLLGGSVVVMRWDRRGRWKVKVGGREDEGDVSLPSVKARETKQEKLGTHS